MKSFHVTRTGWRDLREIWDFIADDSIDAADRVREEFYRAFAQLAETPRIGHRRSDLTRRNVLFGL